MTCKTYDEQMTSSFTHFRNAASDDERLAPQRRCLTITEDVTGAYRVDATGLRGRFASASYAAADPIDVLALVSVLLGLDDEEVLVARQRATALAATMRAAAGVDG